MQAVSSVRRNRQNYGVFLGGGTIREHRISNPALASAVFETGQLPGAGPKAAPLDLCRKAGRPMESVLWKSDREKFSLWIQAGD